ncbi:Mur ligase family protein [Gammaproteobacteria bacterium]|nr:Mur ligase family protein [Gammaproteobacteria bacterium]
MRDALSLLGLDSETLLSRIKIDSRAISKGDVFVAIGSGHQYIASAKQKGAVVIIAEHGDAYHVPDTILWLKEAARLHASRLKAKTIGITGSVGKTSLTQSLKLILAKFGKTSATDGNQNNEIGCALTILNTPLDCEYLIIEMGVAKPYDMDYLVDMLQPKIAVITEVGATHLKDLESTKGIWQEKVKIAAPSTHIISTSQFNHDHTVTRSVYHDQSVLLGQKEVALSQRYSDRVSQTVIAGIVAVLDALSLPISSEFELPDVSQRGMIYQKSAGAIWIDDSYNASLLAYLHALEQLSTYQRKRILIAGEMGGLGEMSSKIHQYFLKCLNQTDLFHVIFYGDAMHDVWMGYYGEASFVTNHAKLQQHLSQYQSDEYVVWIKGSRHLQLEAIL